MKVFFKKLKNIYRKDKDWNINNIFERLNINKFKIKEIFMNKRKYISLLIYKKSGIRWSPLGFFLVAMGSQQNFKYYTLVIYLERNLHLMRPLVNIISTSTNSIWILLYSYYSIVLFQWKKKTLHNILSSFLFLKRTKGKKCWLTSSLIIIVLLENAFLSTNLFWLKTKS